jgi:preprotein translocase subunit SecA
MLGGFVRKVFGTRNDRELKKLLPLVDEVNELEEGLKALSDDELRAQTGVLKERLAQGETTDDILVPAFAVAREAAWRAVGMRPFDVQLLGGMILHSGRISEMKTGEGKTLVATLPAYLNALTGKGVHVVTVNDYLARRDAEWMGRIYRFLGLSVGVVLHGITEEERIASYQADITYGQNNEFGFDYLRDNMKFNLADYVQRDLHFAIVDEVDSILVDEARTPLIISGPADDSTGKYQEIDLIIPRLEAGRTVEKGEPEEGDYSVDEKHKAVILTEEGIEKCEKLLSIDNLYDAGNIDTLHHVNQGLRAHALFQKDVDYVVNDGEIVIVDEFTGRMMPGRRWSDGLHQAVEAKEGMTVERENQTLATITFQNYFRMYDKLSGMTGTADTESIEFKKIYNLDVVVAPTHRPMVRDDRPDVVYQTEREKFDAVADEVEDCRERGQPVLVGTISIEKSELLSSHLKKRGVRHHVLNAKNHGGEASVVTQAGRLGAVTISTNMAGRGTDIVLGGNPEALAQVEVGTNDPRDEAFVAARDRLAVDCETERQQVMDAGGLHIIGTERHESRRIDNQLRGRAGRQGDPGSSRFFLCLEDDLMRIFGAERIQGVMSRLGIEEGEPIEHRMITKAVANAQAKVEGHNFDIRKHLIEYDDVMNKQREVVYHRRRDALGAETTREGIDEMVEDLADGVVAEFVDADLQPDAWDWAEIERGMTERYGLAFDFDEPERAGLIIDDFPEKLAEKAREYYSARETKYGPEVIRHLEKVIMLQTIDQQWKDHLLSMDRLKEGVGLRGYAQQNPLQAYQKEGFTLFGEMIGRIETESIRKLFTVQLVRDEDVERLEEKRKPEPMTLSHGAVSDLPKKPASAADKVGRNDPCPCGSGKKYKRCHGK